MCVSIGIVSRPATRFSHTSAVFGPTPGSSRSISRATGAGAASQQSLGTVVFGGMLASTLLTIPFVSVFYIVMEGFSERRRARKGVDPAQVKVGAPEVAD